MGKLRSFTLIAIVGLAATAFAQVGSNAPAPQPPAADAHPGKIQLDVVVTDKSGHPVPGLHRDDFTLLDNGQPAKIVSFQPSDGAPPAEIYFVIDSVQMGFRRVAYERQELQNYLRKNGGRLAQPVTILLMNDDGATLAAGPSTDGNALAQQLSGIDGSLRPLGLARANPTLPSVGKLIGMNSNLAEQPRRKLLIWLGLLWPLPAFGNEDQHQSEIFNAVVEYSTALRQNRVTVYSLSFGDFRPQSLWRLFLNEAKTLHDVQYGNLSLPVIATQSGGLVLGPDSDLVHQIELCMADTASYYTLTFDPPPAQHPSEYHSLKLKLSKPSLAARTRTAYYDQPAGGTLFAAAPNEPGQKAADADTAPLTIEQLGALLQSLHGTPDDKFADKLAGLALTERLSPEHMTSWKSLLPGPKSLQALTALAAASAFLTPPHAEIPPIAPPDVTAQKQMLARTVDYLKQAIPKLPDFIATRDTVLYETGARTQSDPRWKPVANTTATVRYLGGKEVIVAEGAKKKTAKENDLVTTGVFGPMLSAVFVDAARSQLSWSHWELGPAGGPIAVFRFKVPVEKSSYEVEYRDQPGSEKIGEKMRATAYHGELAINPETGAILRISEEADMNGTSPMVRADIEVEYAPVEIGGKNYICPVRSVSISRTRVPLGPDLARMNDVTFAHYHVFRSETRILENQ